MLSSVIQLEPAKLSRILVVEDNQADGAILRANLKKAFPQAEVHESTDLSGALALLQREKIDFIILDLNLPDSRGIKTLQEIIQLRPHLAVLIHSGDEDSELARESLKLGAQDYLIRGRANADSLKRIIEYSLERKQIERQLATNEQLLTTFIRYSPAGIVVLDKQLRIITASERWMSAHGLKAEEIAGQSIMCLAKYRDARWKPLFDQCLAAEHISCPEDEVSGPNGELRYIRWEMLPWFDGSGAVGGIIKFREDVTEQRALRLALEDAKSNLERTVLERTKDLVSAMIVAESAQAAKDEFFTNMTHELRTPLHAIINFSKFGTKKAASATPDKLVEYFSDIHVSGNRLLGLVNDLLDLTKHKYGRAVINAERNSLSALCDAVASEISAIFEAQQLGLRIQVDEGGEWAFFDMRRIHQVMLNLLGNAAKFSPPNTTVTVEVSCSGRHQRLNGMNDMIVISVIDEGIGIPEAELESVFDEFAQSSKVRSGSFVKGTGLGLAICRQIVQAHAGLIWAENAPVKGAIVRFALPKTPTEQWD